MYVHLKCDNCYTSVRGSPRVGKVGQLMGAKGPVPSVYTSAFLSGAYFDPIIISKHISVILLICSEAA